MPRRGSKPPGDASGSEPYARAKLGLTVLALAVAGASLYIATVSRSDAKDAQDQAAVFAKHAQDQAVVEFKDNLVHEIVDPTSDVLTSARLIVSGTQAIGSGVSALQANQHEYLRLTREWAKTRGELHAILRADYGMDDADAWRNFSGDVSAYLALSYGERDLRNKAYGHLRKSTRFSSDVLNARREGKCPALRQSSLRPHRARATAIQEVHFQCAFDAAAASLRARLQRLVVKLIKESPSFT